MNYDPTERLPRVALGDGTRYLHGLIAQLEHHRREITSDPLAEAREKLARECPHLMTEYRKAAGAIPERVRLDPKLLRETRFALLYGLLSRALEDRVGEERARHASPPLSLGDYAQVNSMVHGYMAAIRRMASAHMGEKYDAVLESGEKVVLHIREMTKNYDKLKDLVDEQDLEIGRLKHEHAGLEQAFIGQEERYDALRKEYDGLRDQGLIKRTLRRLKRTNHLPSTIESSEDLMAYTEALFPSAIAQRAETFLTRVHEMNAKLSRARSEVAQERDALKAERDALRTELAFYREGARGLTTSDLEAAEAMYLTPSSNLEAKAEAQEERAEIVTSGVPEHLRGHEQPNDGTMYIEDIM